MTLGLLIPAGKSINAVSAAQSRKAGADRLEQSPSRLRLHWQHGPDGRLRGTWESVAKLPPDEDAAPDFRPACFGNAPPVALGSARGKAAANRFPSECSNDMQTTTGRRRLAA